MPSAEEPVFQVKAFLDGDDDIDIQTRNFADALHIHVAGLMAEGYSVGYEITLPNGKKLSGWRG